MHIIIFGIIIIVALAVFMMMRETSRDRVGDDASASGSGFPDKYGLAFISDGKLFYQLPGQELRELQSPHVHTLMERMDRHQQLHGWKEGTAFNKSFTGRDRTVATDAVAIQATSVQFAAPGKVLYFLKDDSFGGLFEYDLARGTEKRLLHKQNLSLEDLRISPDGKRLLCAQRAANGANNIVVMSADASTLRELTGGDTVDTAPAWVPDQPDVVLFQSSGLARNSSGYVMAQGPASLQMCDLAAGTLTTVLENPRLDFLQPRVGPEGFLYFIRRPYEAPRVGLVSNLIDVVLFPFRLLRAIFHYLNFFSLMYSRKPLVTASGPAAQADLKDILIKGKRLDAEAALRRGARISGVPSLVPASWELVCRTPQGQEFVMASNVASFDIAADGTILFSNGYGVFALHGTDPPRVLLKNRLVADVVAAPDADPEEAAQIGPW